MAKRKKKTKKQPKPKPPCRPCGDVPCVSTFEGLVIHLPLPAKELQTNRAAGKPFGYLNGIKKQYRMIAQNKASHWADGHRPYWTGATFAAAFYFKDRRSYQDDDNLLNWLKAYRDGIADAGLVTDDRVIVCSSPTQHLAANGLADRMIETSNGLAGERVEITLMKQEPKK